MPADATPIKTVVTDRPDQAAVPATKAVPMSPIAIIGVRVARTALQSFLGILTGMMVTDLIPHTDFLDLFIKAASLSVAPIVLSALHNAAELLAAIDVSNPRLRA